jgi:hypothetical protein
LGSILAFAIFPAASGIGKRQRQAATAMAAA